eukprot:1189878-Prorocentrum_minimum.AAC.3
MSVACVETCSGFEVFPRRRASETGHPQQAGRAYEMRLRMVPSPQPRPTNALLTGAESRPESRARGVSPIGYKTSGMLFIGNTPKLLPADSRSATTRAGNSANFEMKPRVQKKKQFGKTARPWRAGGAMWERGDNSTNQTCETHGISV